MGRRNVETCGGRKNIVIFMIIEKVLICVERRSHRFALQGNFDRRRVSVIK